MSMKPQVGKRRNGIIPVCCKKYKCPERFAGFVAFFGGDFEIFVTILIKRLKISNFVLSNKTKTICCHTKIQQYFQR
jgi:hypothetical protein